MQLEYAEALAPTHDLRCKSERMSGMRPGRASMATKSKERGTTDDAKAVSGGSLVGESFPNGTRKGPGGGIAVDVGAAHYEYISELFDKRDELIRHQAELECIENPSVADIVQRRVELLKIAKDLEAVLLEISVQRGDFLPGDPRLRNVDESPEERGERILTRRDELRLTTRAFLVQLALEENTSVNNIKRLIKASEDRRKKKAQ